MPSTRALIASLVCACAVAAQAVPGPLPVRVTASVDQSQLATAGRATLKLTFVTDAAIERALPVRVELRAARRMFQRRDHAPPQPTSAWQPGASISYDLPLTFALGPPAGTDGAIEVLVGLLDPTTSDPVPLHDSKDRSGLVRVATFTFADAGAATVDVDAAIAAATAIAGKDPQAAWGQLEFAFRRIDSYPDKARLQKALLKVGRMTPAAITFEERNIVSWRIADERARYLRLVAGRMFDRGRLLGALLLLDEVGGALQEQADRAVLGALDDAQRATQNRDAIAAKVFALTKEQEDEVSRLVEQHPDGSKRLAAGVRLAKTAAHRAVGRELVRTLEFTPELRDEARVARETIERAWLAEVPTDERAEANEALQHPSWARTATRTSHCFVLIGPERLIEGIPADSLLRFDLAYLYLTDLFGRVPNPDGDRVTVYWKELWDFNGGTGGGKTINIGNADPQAQALRIDNGLLYHELTHCVEATKPVYDGFREGFADFGAAFVQMELGQVAGGRAAMGLATRAFLLDYLERDLEYWRIPSYGPSAGFLLHFITTYGKSDSGYRWELYRRFFRDYAACRVDDGRTPDIARAFAFHLVQAFGEAAFADLQRFRWPLLDSDLRAIALEQEAAERRATGQDFADCPGSPVPRDRIASALNQRTAGADSHSRALGIVKDWWIIGPFRRDGVDPDTYRFPPELEIDLAARYESIHHNPTWRRPGPKPVTVQDTGWARFEFAYQDDSAFYALTHVEAEHDLEAWVHARADDDLTLFVDDELIGKYDFARGPVGRWRPRGDVLLPDAIRFPVSLTKGRHKLLLKVKNGGGPTGFVLAIAQRNGLPLEGWSTDVEPPAKKLAALEAANTKRWASNWKAKMTTASAVKKLRPTVGGFRARNGAMEGTDTDKQVEWRKYTVRPGFPKDSPSNLAWLPEKATQDLDAFELTIELAPGGRPPKLCVIFQGDGMRDALSGWSLLFDPEGDRVRAFVERYDRRVYCSDTVPYASDPKRPTTLVVTVWARRLTVRLGDQLLFDQAPIRVIPGRERIGLAVWGDEPHITEIELRAPARTR